MKYKDYYAILGVKRDAGADDIKNAYRRLARKYHPDVSKEKDAEEKFKEMAEAYETLKDPEKRAAYDQLGSHAAGQEFRPPPDWAHRGEMTKAVLSILRQAMEPMTTRDIALEMLVTRALDKDDQKLLALMTKRVGVALRLQRLNAVVRSSSGPGQFMLWEIAR